jgi:hypothetical protein
VRWSSMLGSSCSPTFPILRVRCPSGLRRRARSCRRSTLSRRGGRATLTRRNRHRMAGTHSASRSERLISVGTGLAAAGDSRFQGNRGLGAPGDPYYLKVGLIKARGGCACRQSCVPPIQRGCHIR